MILSRTPSKPDRWSRRRGGCRGRYYLSASWSGAFVFSSIAGRASLPNNDSTEVCTSVYTMEVSQYRLRPYHKLGTPRCSFFSSTHARHKHRRKDEEPDPIGPRELGEDVKGICGRERLFKLLFCPCPYSRRRPRDVLGYHRPTSPVRKGLSAATR